MSQNLFNTVMLDKPNSNVFDLSHDHKLSGNMGKLIPVCVMECVPGDKHMLSAQSLIRFAPMLAPIMHRVDQRIEYFFVPNRLIWDGWEDFIGAKESAPAFPYVDYSVLLQTAGGGLGNYLGLPILPGSFVGTISVSALPFAAYQFIYNEWYRDENLIDEVDYKCINGNQAGAGGNVTDLLSLRTRAWEHDYFTAALPFAQKGPAVNLPIGNIPVVADTDDAATSFLFNGTKFPGGGTQGLVIGNADFDYPAGNGFLYAQGDEMIGGGTINDLRRAYALQKFLEKNARGGTRYNELILAHFGVRSSDQRLQRPEYIVGVKSPVVISEVLNTTGTEDLPQGNMSGHGLSVTNGNFGSYFCEEHGYIIGIMSIVPKTAYQDGVPKHFLKINSPYDYYWPEFANIGEQEVLQVEVYGATANPDDVFGYQPRYAEYKFMNSRVSGDFATTLDFWHLGRKFASDPALNKEFIECNPSTRIFAVDDPDTHHLWCHVLNRIRSVRRMPKYGTPTY